ncbi:cytochrome P450 [Rhodofomes roseus]|uniref:Cytochrome P450 n=1 Tax=Rhodofomes roseus TaxID=34475 RepID=A0ABQ8KS18_9APHY|nr:cytochrome P450 [Rhodofomes roseus]KAH9840925.1 cytochrome P450 [Rhodofomes roseus]
MATLTFSQALTSLLAVWVFWRVSRKALATSPLDNIPGPRSGSFVSGNYGQMYHRQGWKWHERLWRKYGSVIKLHVSFGQPCLYVFDPTTLRHILAPDQGALDQPGFVVDSYQLFLGPGSMSATGDRHRRWHKLLHPVFSPRNLREMLPVLYKTTRRLRDAIGMEVGNGPKEVDILKWMNRGALESIGLAGLGYAFDALVESDSNNLARAIKALFPAVSKLGIIQQLAPWLMKLGPSSFRRRVAEAIPNETVQQLVEIVDTIEMQSREIVETRKALLEKGDAALAGQAGSGKDVITFLLKANMQVAESDRLTDEEVIAQIGTFTIAATDSIGSMVTQMLHYLSEHLDVQDALRREIIEARRGDDTSFEELMKLPLLDGVVKETLRLNPASTIIPRDACKDIVAPLSSPIRGVDGRLMTEVTIPKGTTVFLGVRASNCNPALWGEDAMEWKPERWMRPLPTAVAEAKIPGVFGSLLSFGGGARTCIGFKFAEIEIKTILYVLLESFKLTPPGKDIAWNIATIRYPTVGKEGMKPELPLIMTPVAT